MANDPLHGVTLEMMVVQLVDFFTWEGLSEQVPINCFGINPSVPSSLKFLRRTPWARAKVESLYGYMLREKKRQERTHAADTAVAPDAPVVDVEHINAVGEQQEEQQG
jgi:uncharacterized protein (DUF2132 family)